MGTEKDLENWLCGELNRCSNSGPAGIGSSILSSELVNSTSDAGSLGDLIGRLQFDLIQNDSRWNLNPRLMVDVCGNKTPDVVLRSRVSTENRIYIEVKNTEPLRDGVYDSQVVRYFLHLLGTTRKEPSKKGRDIRRAIILAAPTSWFKDPENAKSWGYFLRTYSDLAKCFDITLAELHVDDVRTTQRAT